MPKCESQRHPLCLLYCDTISWKLSSNLDAAVGLFVRMLSCFTWNEVISWFERESCWALGREVKVFCGIFDEVIDVYGFLSLSLHY